MDDQYYLKQSHKKKIETFTYEYDKFEGSMAGDAKYFVNIIFENDKFARIDFGDNKRKKFEDNLRQKEINLINKIQEEIKNIEKRKEDEKYDILDIKLKPTPEQISLINSAIGDSESAEIARNVMGELFSNVISYILNKIKINKIPFKELNVPCIKFIAPLNYEIEIYNPNMGVCEESTNNTKSEI